MAAKPKRPIVRLGDRVRLGVYGVYIVAQVGDGVFTLINLKSGNRWGTPVEKGDYLTGAPIRPLLGKTYSPLLDGECTLVEWRKGSWQQKQSMT